MISLDKFEQIVKNTPLITIDFIIYNSKGQILLGKRNNKPARLHYFTPGGRIFKSENFKDAVKRLSEKELNYELKMEDLLFVGVFEQLFDESIFEGISLHCIDLVYSCNVDKLENLPNIEHDDYIYVSKNELLEHNLVHHYVKDFFNTKGLS